MALLLRGRPELAGVEYIQTSEISGVQFQTTAIKQVIMCLLVEGLDFNL